MSGEHHVALECSCLKATDASCSAGGEFTAHMIIEANMGTTIQAEGELTSPPVAEFCMDTVSAVVGSGPLYTVTLNGCDCTCLDDTWVAEISANYQTYYYSVVSINGCDVTLQYTSSTDAVDRQIEALDAIRLDGSCPETAPIISTAAAMEATLTFLSEVESRLTSFIPIDISLDAEGELDDGIKVDYALSELLTLEGNLNVLDIDKVAGEFGDFKCQEKLYPQADLPVASGFGSFVGPLAETSGLYSFIDEGVYEGILKDGGDSVTLSDDVTSYINPDTVHTEGLFQYKCDLTNLNVRPDYTALRMRVAAPLENYESSVPPLYTVYNIQLLDPSGNLIVKYNDISLKGDSTVDQSKFSTYSSLPESNAIDDYDWGRRTKPHMQMVSGYQLHFSVRAVSLDDAFTEGFSEGFEENYILPDILTDGSGNNYLALDGAPLSTQEVKFLNPTNGFKISAIEICNSGGFGPRREDYFPAYMEVPSTGRRLERCIRAQFMPQYDFDTTIYPSVDTVWVDDVDSAASPLGVTNEDICGAQDLVRILGVPTAQRFIKVQSASGGGVADSGKLMLRFGECSTNVDEITQGAFNYQFDQSTNNMWFSPSGAFNTENRRENVHKNDSIFYTVDTITLKVLAKKAFGTRDYVLDVVGYSEDKLLHDTSPSGGFLQNPSGVFLNDQYVGSVGSHPVISGFYSDDDDYIVAGGSLSEHEDYWEASGNSGGDHYSLTQYPVVSGTEFAWYEVPLQILDDDVRLGLSQDYSMSSYLEKIYLDIFPLPSGASIAYTELCVRYAPSNALNLFTQGGKKFGKVQDGRSEAALYPTSMGSTDDILNAGSGYGPLSSISGIHSYTSDGTIKSNYARRWRGSEGTVCGPYDPDMFGFGFENPTIDYPFLSGYYRFDNVDGLYVQSTELGSGLGTVSGLFATTPEVYHNVGWRYSSGTLFQSQLPGYSGSYTTSDWTSLASGAVNFVGNPLYGKIADAFDRSVRISQDTQNINFGNVSAASGFSVFVRFTPDPTVSGVGYDLFQSGVICSKWDTPSQLDFALGYSGGYLCGYARDTSNNIISIADTVPYSGYQFPLNAILTYNDHQSSGLKLYTDNEFLSPFNVLRASSVPFRKADTNADLTLGWSAGSGVGMNMLVSEFGISSWSSGVKTLYGSGTNIVESNADKTYKGVTAEKFLENSRVKFFDPSESYTNDRYKLWDRVNEDTYNDWALGAFEHCQFGMGYDQWQLRPNTEHIIFDIQHSGTSYSNSVDLPTPSAIDSGVSYHTQLENDFLRFHLSDIPNNFYAVNRRITKNIPCGYTFSENAIVVESVVSHKTGMGISWSGCGDVLPSGPRMIVSLYTKNQDPYWTPDEPNWGLVNRKSHYLKPSGCIQKLESSFTYDDICDETEAWSLFPSEPRVKDFSERYFSDDVNDMFVQYDLVYPSGPAYSSKIELHSSHVRMEDANVCDVDVSGTMNLYASGAFPSESQLNLNVGGFPQDSSGTLPLTMNIPLPYDVFATAPSGFTLNLQGAFVSTETLPLFTPHQSGVETFTLNISGEIPSSLSNSMSLALPEILGRHDTSDDFDPLTTLGGSGTFFGMPLTMFNADVATTPTGPVLRLNTFASSSGSTGLQSTTPLTLWNSIQDLTTSNASGDVNLNLLGGNTVTKRRFVGSMPMFINAPNVMNVEVPLYLHNPAVEALSSGTMNLVTANYSSNFGSAFGLWYNNNYGTGIELTDDHVATLDVTNEIRGVDLTGYGSCTGNSPSKAVDPILRTDCTTWRAATCNDGGIFRATETYTNSGAINFSGDLGYSGNYYGLRKYTELMPSVAYNATMTIKTGSTDPISVPPTFEEWGYGMCGTDWDCCTEDCDQDLVFSGVKFIGDDAASVAPSANLTVDSPFIVASGRSAGDEYGSQVSVKGDLMAISAPHMTIPEFDQNRVDAFGNADPGMVDVSGAGSVFLYRRGTDVAGKSASWNLIEPLTLPTGFRKDYIQRTAENLLTFDQFSISGNKWQIGQEGREFGSSLDMAVSGDREVVVVGAPRAKWNREFTDIETSGIPTAGLIFTDLFDYNKSELASVASTASRFNILWKYFSAPWNAGPSEWYAEINPKIVVLQLTYSNKEYPVVPSDESSWFTHRYIPRLDDLALLEDVGSGLLGGSGSLTDWIAAARPVISDQQHSGVMEAWFESFPAGQNTLYSGIPAIVGMFQEQTGSTAGALQYADTGGNAINLYDRFSSFYLAYSSQSGVFDPTTNLAQSGHLNKVFGQSENWATTASALLTNTFDSGRLSSTYTNSTLNRNFVASGVGQDWGDTHGSILTEFQVPPASGGRVYIFEKERDNFNCVQVITSPNDIAELEEDNADIFGATYANTYNDRFGHSVAISTNGEIVSVGSPWNSVSCRVFERNADEDQRVYDNVLAWCQAESKTAAESYYAQIVLLSGVATAKTATYDFLSSSERFEFRNDINFWTVLPQSYSPSYSYGYGDIAYIGTRQFLPKTFAPTSRLGWSTAVNDDGDVVAFGAPTDSFNEFEDSNVWGDGKMRWASHHNAGAVRMFASRKYHSHSGVVEFGRFGNLDRSSHKAERDAGYYETMNLVFASGANGSSDYQGKYWRRTDFSEIEIPQDAGLAFIMTPELDSASDEIIDNIKNWLALGDRNLVLVGNDPTWEENGLYADSNGIINNVLEKLGSRMRIHAAKSIEHSMQGCVSQDDLNADKYNVTKAKIPSYSTGATIGRNNYYAKGVGDIRMHLERDSLTGYSDEMGCPEGATCDGSPPPIVNSRCEFPLEHGGDLRAEWTEQCLKTTPNTCKVVTYKKNWPLQFGNFTPNCDDPPTPLFTKVNQEPVPILTTAEHLPPSSWLRPATSGYYCDYRTLYKWEVHQAGSLSGKFAEDNLDVVSFNISEDVDSSVSGEYNSFTYSGDFFDPDSLNGRDGLLQGVGRSYYPEDEERIETRVIYPDSILGLVESGRKTNGDLNNSRVYIIGSQWGEDDASRGIDAATQNDDKNTEFYINMVRKDCTSAPRGIQINGFTGRTSLSDAYESGLDHGLGDKLNVEFSVNGGAFDENQEATDLNNLVDFAWVANPSGKPSASELQELQNWMDLGNKKLVITFNATSESSRQQIADNVNYLCSGLSVTSRPILMPNIGEYFVTENIIKSYDPTDLDVQSINTSTDSVSGCDNGYTFTFPNYQAASSLSGLHFSDSTLSENKDVFIPLSGGSNYEKIIWWEDDVTEPYTVYPTNKWKIDADATVEFPAVSGSGYRVFVNWVSEKVSEKFDICGTIVGATHDPLGEEDSELFTSDIDGSICGSDIDLSKTTVLTPSQSIYDLKAIDSKITINLSTSPWRTFIPHGDLIDGVLPTTPRLISISGCPLPIDIETVITTTSGQVPTGVEEYNCRWEVNPLESGSVPAVSRPVSNKSEIYCNSAISAQCEYLGDELIEDGPVVAAEEFENFSSFQTGRRRSKIIVISDSTLLQGQCAHYRAETLSGNQEFIRSLYPDSLDVVTTGLGSFGDDYIYTDVDSVDVNGRNWFFSQKLRAPERGSAAKYHAISGHAVSNIQDPLYGGAGVVGSLDNYYDDEDTYDPSTLTRPAELKSPEQIKQRVESFYTSDALGTHGIYPRFSGDFLNINPPQTYEELMGESGNKKDFITDAKVGGGLNDLMKATNTDYLDLDVYYSGCLGDLFGYSIDMSDNKLVVGSPFNAYYTEGAISGVSGIVQWHEIENDPSRSGVRIAEDGGAGAVFVYEKTGSGENVVSEFLPWEFQQKIKPSSLNVGIVDFSPSPIVALEQQRDDHDILDASFIVEFAKRSDNFGVSVSIDCDMIAIGAPNHDFETIHGHIYSGAVQPNGLNTAFQRKSFNAEYDIPNHVFYDLGSSGVRVDQFSNTSGTMVLNNGAVFNYRNEIVDFQSRGQSWIYAEKLYAQGHNDRVPTLYTDDGLGGFFVTTSGTENDRFGSSVSVDRAGRGDSDYVMAVGSPRHSWATSGNHPTSGLLDAGAGYSFDAMLRGQVPSIPNSGGWIEAHVFGQKKDRDATDRLETRVYQNISGDSLSYQVSGIIFSNPNGDIFLEVSGFDPSTKGFVAHRPYVEQVDLTLFAPTPSSGMFNLVTSGRAVDNSGDMNLTLIGPDSANVYNTMNLYQSAVLGSPSGTMNLNIEAPSGHSGILNLNMTNNQTTDSLSLRIRGY